MTTTRNGIDAVTFDYWNTLAYEERGHLRGIRIGAWIGLLEDAGFAAERADLEVVYDKAWDRFQAAWKANEQFRAAQAAEAIIEDLGFDVPGQLRVDLVESFTGAGEQATLHLTDGIEACLRTLRDAGIKLGIVCDVGFTPSNLLRHFLEGAGVLELFDHWSFSDEVGAYKPSPVIFEHALAGLGAIAPDRAAHVGDIRRTDVAGALGMGMVAVRYTGVSDDETEDHPEAHHVIARHQELPEVLGVGR